MQYRRGVKWFVTGFIGVFKAVKGIDAAMPNTVYRRLAWCLMCHELNDRKCKVCGCFVVMKATIESQKCPIGRW